MFPRAPAQALDLKLVIKADLVRLKVIARVHARGLPRSPLQNKLVIDSLPNRKPILADFLESISAIEPLRAEIL